MRIAVTYENGNVFQHFGHTETFKVYEVEDGKVVSSALFGSNGSGHGALASLLNDKVFRKELSAALQVTTGRAGAAGSAAGAALWR